VTGPQRHTHSFWSFLCEKTKLECGKKPPAFRQRQAHNAVRHAARSRPARSAPGHRARTRAPRERVSRAAAEGRRAECVCEAESELESVRSLQSFLALSNHPCSAPSICIAHTIAILLHDECAIYDPHPTPLCMQYTIQYWS